MNDTYSRWRALSNAHGMKRKEMQSAPRSSSMIELVPNIEEVRHRLNEIQAVHAKLMEDLVGLGESMKKQSVRLEALATWLKSGKPE